MKLKLLIAGLVIMGVFGGCSKGEKGDKGDPGNVLGGSSFIYTGAITAEPTLVNIPNLSVEDGDFVSVYVCKTSGPSGVPCDQITSDTSLLVHYQAQRASVVISGALAHGYSTYSISAVIR